MDARSLATCRGPEAAKATTRGHRSEDVLPARKALSPIPLELGDELSRSVSGRQAEASLCATRAVVRLEDADEPLGHVGGVVRRGRRAEARLRPVVPAQTDPGSQLLANDWEWAGG